MSLSLLLPKKFIEQSKNEALVTIKKDRDNFSVIWDTAEKYCRENNLIISDKFLLANKEDSFSAVIEKSYKIYSVNPFYHANDLTNKIHDALTTNVNRKFMRLKTIKTQTEFIIEYNTRNVVFFYKIQKHKSTNPINIIKPHVHLGLQYFPAEIELIDIYHDLYTMQKTEENQELEKILFSQVEERYTKGIFGSSQLSCKNKKKEFIESFKLSIIKDWLPNQGSKCIIIGAWLFDIIRLGNDKLCTNLEKIQLISTMKPKELLDKLTYYIKKFKNYEITMREQELHIPKDFRISRFTYYIKLYNERGAVEKPFLDLFTCAEFEIIPCHKSNNYYFASKWVIVRFLFIDLWIIRVIKILGLISDSILNIKIASMWKMIDFFRDDKYLNIIDKYIGEYHDYNVDKKLENTKQDGIFQFKI